LGGTTVGLYVVNKKGDEWWKEIKCYFVY
jgi:hypothetical protein